MSDDLTPAQRMAVEHVSGPLLVLAGPGSGKTRVITRRIAHLIAQGIPPRQLLAITFTNKASGEMAHRVQELLPGTSVWVSTFHKFCARLLRQHASIVGLQANFTILDTSDQRAVLRRIVSDLDLDPVHYSPEKLGYRISTAKNDLVTAESVRPAVRGVDRRSLGGDGGPCISRLPEVAVGLECCRLRRPAGPRGRHAAGTCRAARRA